MAVPTYQLKVFIISTSNNTLTNYLMYWDYMCLRAVRFKYKTSPVKKVYHKGKLKFKTKISKISTKTLDKTTATESSQVTIRWWKLAQNLPKK